MLLTELAMVEEEIIFLERKVDQLKLNLRQERKQNKEWEMLLFKEVHPTMGQWHWHKKILSSSSSNSKQTDYDGGGQHRKNRILQERRTSLGSSTDFETSSFRSSIGNKSLGYPPHPCFFFFFFSIYIMNEVYTREHKLLQLY